MRELFVYLTIQDNDVCPMTGHMIAKNYGELIHFLKYNDKRHKENSGEKFITCSYIIPTVSQKESLFDSVKIIFPDGTVETYEADNLDQASIHLYHKFEDSCNNINSQMLKKPGVTQKIASSFIKWRDGLFIEEHQEELDEAMSQSVKEAREEDIQETDKMDDLDLLVLIMKQFNLNDEDIEQIVYNGTELQEEEYQDFYRTLMRVIISRKNNILPNQVHASDLETYEYTISFKDDWVITGRAESTIVNHNGITQSIIDKNEDWK